jgi:hypothetical protein
LQADFFVTDHGIAVLNNSAVVQYRAMLVVPFMVLVIEPMPRRIGRLPLSPVIFEPPDCIVRLAALAPETLALLAGWLCRSRA